MIEKVTKERTFTISDKIVNSKQDEKIPSYEIYNDLEQHVLIFLRKGKYKLHHRSINKIILFEDQQPSPE